MQPTPDTEITLTQGNWQLVVAPYGASLRGLFTLAENGTRTQVITGYSGAKNKEGGQGDVLIPFPGRIGQGRYTFGGQALQMEKNDKEGPSAIHGFLRHTLWETDQSQAGAVTFQTDLHESEHPGYPFALNVQVTYSLSETGLSVSFAIRNTGKTDAPVAAGFHPYFSVGSALIDADTLQVPFASRLEFDDLLIPTGSVLPVAGTPLDFRQPRALADTVLNTCYLHPQRDPDGLVRVRLSDSVAERSVTVWMDSGFAYVVLYSGDPLPEHLRRRSLAIEPMTCASDAFNHPEWGLVTLAPGTALSGRWGVTTD